MKVKKIIEQVATLLQLQNVSDANLDDSASFDDQTRRDVNLIVSSLNEVLSDIATDYLPQTETEKIDVQNGEFDLDNLSKPFYKLIKFDGEYVLKLNKLQAKSGVHIITYSHLPNIVELDDEFSCDSRLTIQAISYGIAKEYCLICGSYDESALWESKFKNAMQVAIKKQSVVELKHRRWC
jgi:hypothetical protein